jgi:hypothetical protein
MFFKDKYKAKGSFDKTKVRIVANRQKRDYSLIGETSSKTVNPITNMTLAHLPLMYEEYEMSAHDIKEHFFLPWYHQKSKYTQKRQKKSCYTEKNVSTRKQAHQ